MNRLAGEAPLASPELALVDADLAAELRRTLSPVEDSWPRPPSRVENASTEAEEDAPAQLESAGDSGHAESPDAERLHDDEHLVSTPEQTPAEELRPSSYFPVLPAPEPEEEGSPLPLASFDEASAESADDTPSWWEDIVVVPEQTPVQEQRSSHYPVLPAPEQGPERFEETDAALRRIRERMNESDESPAGKNRLRRHFTLGSGVVAMCALGVFAADAELQVGQLPHWLPF